MSKFSVLFAIYVVLCVVGCAGLQKERPDAKKADPAAKPKLESANQAYEKEWQKLDAALDLAGTLSFKTDELRDELRDKWREARTIVADLLKAEVICSAEAELLAAYIPVESAKPKTPEIPVETEKDAAEVARATEEQGDIPPPADEPEAPKTERTEEPFPAEPAGIFEPELTAAAEEATPTTEQATPAATIPWSCWRRLTKILPVLAEVVEMEKINPNAAWLIRQRVEADWAAFESESFRAQVIADSGGLISEKEIKPVLSVTEALLTRLKLKSGDLAMSLENSGYWQTLRTTWNKSNPHADAQAGYPDPQAMRVACMTAAAAARSLVEGGLVSPAEGRLLAEELERRSVAVALNVRQESRSPILQAIEQLKARLPLLTEWAEEKSPQPTVAKLIFSVTEGDISRVYDPQIAVLLPHAERMDALETAEKAAQALRRVRKKIEEK